MFRSILIYIYEIKKKGGAGGESLLPVEHGSVPKQRGSCAAKPYTYIGIFSHNVACCYTERKENAAAIISAYYVEYILLCMLS